MNRNRHLYNDDQISFIEHELKHFLSFFGYTKNESDPENFTPFFNVPVDENYNAFRKRNEETMANLDEKHGSYCTDAEYAMDEPKFTWVCDRLTYVGKR